MVMRLDDNITGMFQAKVIDVGDREIPVSIPIYPKYTAKPEYQPPPTKTNGNGNGNGVPYIAPLGVLSYDQVIDLWTLLLGTPADKVETATEMLPIDVPTPPMDFPELYKPSLTIPTPTGVTGISLPDFGDIGKWLLIGGAALLAVLVLPKLFRK